MQERGKTGEQMAPWGNAVWTSRAFPRRAFRPALSRRSPGLVMAPGRDHRVLRVGGRLKLVTTVTIERWVTEAELGRLGIPVPPPDLPWIEGKPDPVPPRRVAPPSMVAPMSPYAQVMTAWRRHFDSFDPRMPSLVPMWLDEFGLDGVLSAIEAVASKDSPEPAYRRLNRRFREIRQERKGPGP